MKIDLIISADYIEENKIKDKIVVVIDMLRAPLVIRLSFKINNIIYCMKLFIRCDFELQLIALLRLY